MSVFLLLGCEKHEQKYFSESPEIDASKTLLNHFVTRNYDGIKTIYSDSAKIFDNTTKPETLESMLASMKQNEAMLEYEKLGDSVYTEMVITKENEKWVNVWGVWKGKLKGGSKELEIPMHSTWRFVDGKIVEDHTFYNAMPIYLELESIKAADTLQTE